MNSWRIRRTGSVGSAPVSTPLSRSFSGTTELDAGLDVVSNGQNPRVDLIAVHGLNGHREKTWTTASGVNWLRDILSSDIPNARIMTYAYNSRTHGSDQLIAQSLYQHAITFVQVLCAYRRNTKTETRPIIFLAHSLGGILVKAALIHSNLNTDQNTIKLSTYGIVFFGTPHSGSSIASFGTTALTLLSPFARTNTRVIRHLQVGSDWLEMQAEQFRPISSGLEIITFYETYKKEILGRGILIVSPQSATLVGSNSLAFPLRKNHTDLVRFESKFDSDYLIVCDHLKSLVKKASAMGISNSKVSEEDAGGSTLPSAPNTSSDNMHRLAPSAAPRRISSVTVPFSLPVQQNPGFIGRKSPIGKLHDYLCAADKTPGSETGGESKVAVLHGLGGVGKTQISIAFAQHHKRDFDAVFWIDASSKRNTLLSFRSVAQRLLKATVQKFVDVEEQHESSKQVPILSRLHIGEYVSSSGHISTGDNDLPKITSLVVEFLQSEDESFTWLMVMDNLDTLEDYPLTDYLPQNKQRGKVIITTRLTALTSLGHSIEIDQIDEESGIQILLNAARLRTPSETDPEDAKAIANALGLLPLALEQAGAYINETRMQLSKYLGLLDRRLRELMSRSSPNLTSGLTGNQTPVFATWELSFERLGEDGARLLTLLAFLHNSTFWDGLLLLDDPSSVADYVQQTDKDSKTPEPTKLPPVFTDEFLFNNALGKIFSVSLAKPNSPDGTVYLHPLVHAWARERLSPEDRHQNLIQAVIVVGRALESAHTSPKIKDARKFISRIVPHADHCINLINKEGPHVRDTIIFPALLTTDPSSTRALYHLGILFQDTSRLKEAEAIYTSIISIPTSTSTSESTPAITLANTRRRLAQIMILYSRYTEAESLLLTAKSSLLTLLGPHHEDTVTAMLELGMTYHRRHEYTTAEVHLREAISNGTDPVTGRMGRAAREASSILGLVYRHLGRLKDALEILSRALEQASSHSTVTGTSDRHPDEDDRASPAHLSTIQYRHAIILQELGHWTTAMQTYAAVYATLSAINGADHPLTLRTVNALGRMYCFLGRYGESRDMLDVAWEGQEALGFSRENETAQLRTLFNVGVLNREEGLYGESLEVLGRVRGFYEGLFAGKGVGGKEKGAGGEKGSNGGGKEKKGEGGEAEKVVEVSKGGKSVPKLKFPLQDVMLEIGITLTAFARSCRGSKIIMSGSGGRTGRQMLQEAVEILETLLESQLLHNPDHLVGHCQTRVALAEAYLEYHEGAMAQQAEEVLGPALDFAREKWDEDNPLRLKVELAHISVLLESGQGRNALDAMERGDMISNLKRAFGERHQTTMRGKVLLAMAYYQVERAEEARKTAWDVVGVLKDTLDKPEKQHPMTREVTRLVRGWDRASGTGNEADGGVVSESDGESGKSARFGVRVGVLSLGRTF